MDPREAYSPYMLQRSGVICPGLEKGTGLLWLCCRREMLLPDRNDSYSATTTGVSHMRANKGRTKDVRRRRRRNGMSDVKPDDNISTSGIYDHFKQHNLTGSYRDGY